MLITGASGSLADCFRHYLEGKGCEPIMVSRTGRDGVLALEELFNSEILERVDTVIHFAWSTLPATAECEPDSNERYDLPLLSRLLQRIAEIPISNRPHFIFSSSAGTVYGNCYSKPVDEKTPCRPIGRYGIGKRRAEKVIEACARRYGLSVCILRISNCYGFMVSSTRMQGIIPHIFACAWEGRELSLWGDGSARKDFIHYSDLNRALSAVSAKRLNGTFNVAFGESASLREVIAIVEREIGRKISVNLGPHRPWDVQVVELDNRKLCNAADWLPLVKVEDGIRKMHAELRLNGFLI